MVPNFSLKPCPASGDGVHTWVYYAACTLVEADYSDEDPPKFEAALTRCEIKKVGVGL